MKMLKTVSGVLVVIGALFILAASLFAYATASSGDFRGWLFTAGSLALGVYFIILAVGLWNAKTWAWWLAIATIAIQALWGVFVVVTNFSYWELARLLIAVTIVSGLYACRKFVSFKQEPKAEIEEIEEMASAPVLGGKLGRNKE